jgi:hypothetical protein
MLPNGDQRFAGEGKTPQGLLASAGSSAFRQSEAHPHELSLNRLCTAVSSRTRGVGSSANPVPARMADYRRANTFAMNSPVVWSYVPSKRPFAELSHSKFFDKVW